MTQQAFPNIKVLDLTWYIAGPYCTKLLADYGADVIKVERPWGGDPARNMGPFQGGIPHPERSGLFFHLNTNKRSITLNLKCATGRKLLLELAKDADCVIESFRPGAMAGLGLDYSALEKVNPHLVMVSLSNFGQTGPYRDFEGSELTLYAIGGEMYSQGLPDREPLKYYGTVASFQAGLVASLVTMGALYGAKDRGIGQYIDLSIYELLAANVERRGTFVIGYAYSGQVAIRVPSGARGFPMGVYPCRDGYVDFWGLGRWPQVIQMLGMPELLNDPRFCTPLAQMQPGNREQFDAILLPWLMKHTKHEVWQKALDAGVLCGPLNIPADLPTDPHLAARGFWAEGEHPEMGKVKFPGRPFSMEKAPWSLRRPAPLLGQHNQEVYCHKLGYSKEDLVRLRESGVI